MRYTCLDMKTYKRKDHFAYFSGLAYPYVGVTNNVDITNLLGRIKAERLPFFLTVCYCVSKAANGVAEFRQRIWEQQIFEFKSCRYPSCATMRWLTESIWPRFIKSWIKKSGISRKPAPDLYLSCSFVV